MKVDTGLQDGVKTLRQDNQLLDLTLRVDGQEFRVHKVVLASVSDYFRAMLCGSLKESKSDVVELKEVSAEEMSKLLDFIYTGDNNLIKSNPRQMLQCGVYFQIPRVIEECRQILTGSLCVSNCLELLSLFLRFPLEDTAEMIGDFIKQHLKKVMDHYSLREMTPEALLIILNNWKKSDWDLFQYLTSWYLADCENRRIYMDDFLIQVRFKLMTPNEITAVKETGVYAECDGAWRGLIEKASTYHQLPIHQKVLDKSVQNRVRSANSVLMINTGKVARKTSATYVLCKNEQMKHCWKRYKAVKQPKVRRRYPYVIEVNNFLIICCESTKTQHWEVFDPRTLMWYEMANMPRQKNCFALVHHDKQLYVLGGYDEEGHYYRGSDTAEVYDFDTNTWKSTINLPSAMTAHAACVFHNNIYISGGNIGGDWRNSEQTARMDCLNISSQTWESKAPMLTAMSDHKLFVMKINKKKAIVAMGRYLEMDYYNPETDQWSNCNFSFEQIMENPPDPSRYDDQIRRISVHPLSSVVVRGNTLYLFEVEGMQLQYFDYDENYVEDGEYWFSRSLCVKLIIPEEGSEVQEVVMKDIPVRDPKRDPYQIGALLAFPARSTTENS